MRQAILVLLATPLFAQDSLSLREAVQAALRQNRDHLPRLRERQHPLLHLADRR
jgi:hypothetical protein